MPSQKVDQNMNRRIHASSLFGGLGFFTLLFAASDASGQQPQTNQCNSSLRVQGVVQRHLCSRPGEGSGLNLGQVFA